MGVRARTLPSAIILSSLGSAAIVAFISALANFAYAPMTFVIWLAIGFAANVLFAASLGLAWHSFAYARGWRNVQAYVVPGLIVGITIPFLLFVLPPILGGDFDFHIAGFLFVICAVIGMALGGFTALVAWLIRRPDRDAPNPDRATP